MTATRDRPDDEDGGSVPVVGADDRRPPTADLFVRNYDVERSYRVTLTATATGDDRTYEVGNGVVTVGQGTY